jgi:PLP dependent protein
MIKAKLAALRTDIEAICCGCGRNPQDITLVGVTKFATVDNIKEAVAAGLTDIGENKIQFAKEKFSGFPPEFFLKIRKHLIGHLQTNKVKFIFDLFDVVQSVDSLKLAAEIDLQAKKRGCVVDVLIQVNCSGEEQKSGISKAEAFRLLEAVSGFSHLNVLGLMTIAPLTDDEARIRSCFRDLKLLFDSAAKQFNGCQNITMKYLSMGMTHDYKIALEEGATMLRIGSAIFA